MANKYKTIRFYIMSFVIAVMTLVSCSNNGTHKGNETLTNEQEFNDSLNFALTHHYSNNYNCTQTLLQSTNMSILLWQKYVSRQPTR